MSNRETLLKPEQLRWTCPTDFDDSPKLPKETEVNIVGQEDAVKALQFGLDFRAPGQNIYIRGLRGTGRMNLVQGLLTHQQFSCARLKDHCYVHNFSQPDRPIHISLPRGQGKRFRYEVEQLREFILGELKETMQSEPIRKRIKQMEKNLQVTVNGIVTPFQEKLARSSLALVMLEVGPNVRPAIFPAIENKPVTPEDLDQLISAGKADEDALQKYQENREKFEPEFEAVSKSVQEHNENHRKQVHDFLNSETRNLLKPLVFSIRSEFNNPKVDLFLSELTNHVVQHQGLLHQSESVKADFTEIYEVNLLVGDLPLDQCPVVTELSPNLRNLLGGIDQTIKSKGEIKSNHMSIHAGSMLRADGGFLILDAQDILAEPGAWRALTRILRSGRLEIVPPEYTTPWVPQRLTPEPIEIDVKVVLVGDANIYYLLNQQDPDFSELFKVLADFDDQIPRTSEGIQQYAQVIRKIEKEEDLVHFHASAIARLVEHGARVIARKDKLTARFGRIADLAREASYLAKKNGKTDVHKEQVKEAIVNTRQRASLPSRRYHELLQEGVLRLETHGSTVGQINGLAVMTAGPLTYGFPARITASIGAGSEGLVNVERESLLSGAIHTKGFFILEGLLRYLLKTDFPLTFSASLAFEQSYGGIDGDSASGAEICCLLSALTDIPIRQDFALTGAIDQMGNILPIGGANEKIEGFFDCCRCRELTGTQGVIIPESNVGDLMLREDVVEACEEKKFFVYGAKNIHEVLELLMDMPAGTLDRNKNYPRDSILGKAQQKALEFWKSSLPKN